MIFYFTILTSLFLVATAATSNSTNANSSIAGSDHDPLSAPKAGGCAASVLAKHNTYRAKHGSPALTLDSTISAVAQAWADKLAASGEIKHSGNSKYGENIAAGQHGDQGPLVDMWYDEVSKYKSYGGEPNIKDLKDWGHFTQLVWKSTTSVGCGCADSQKGKYQQVMVCNYQPPGNMIGEFKNNVFPPK